MKPVLYECFKKWNKGCIYLYSDPHFSDLECYKLRFSYRFNLKDDCNEFHDKLSKLTGMPRFLYDTMTDEDVVNKLDRIQINNINKKCGKNDTLIILGDVGNIECIKKLKAGYKVLILGNHDKGVSNYKKKDDNNLFDEVYEGTLQISPKIMLSHEPVDYPYCLNIHGHVHSNEEISEIHYNCCAEHIDYVPVSLKSIIESGELKNIDDIHRCTIDSAIKRKKESENL